MLPLLLCVVAGGGGRDVVVCTTASACNLPLLTLCARLSRNVDWQTSLDKDLRDIERKAAGPQQGRAAQPQGGGFLSLSRSLALDDPGTALDSPTLRSLSDGAAAGPSREAPMTLAEGLAPLQKAFKKSSTSYVPTRGERKQWQSSGKFTTSSSDQALAAASEGDAAREAARLDDLQKYAQLKQELTLLTAGLAVGVTALLGAAYDKETAISYACGAAGSLLYLRLLTRSVDTTNPAGASGIGDVVEGTLGGQRLLVPAILVAAWNRWNALAAPVTGVELHVLPILVGFFTYKGATVIQLFRDLLPARQAGSSESSSESSSNGSSGPGQL